MNRRHLDLLFAGLHAGDSLGSTSEGVAPDAMPAWFSRYREQGWPFRQVGGGHLQWRPGQGTDDTQMARCLVRGYLLAGGFDGDSIARQFVEWIRGGPRGVGGTVQVTLGDVLHGVPWHQGGLRLYREDPDNLPNGSLMRNGVVPALAGSRDECLAFALRHSVITHYAPLCVLCCAAQAWLLWGLLHGEELRAGWERAFGDDWKAWLAQTEDEVARNWRGEVGGDLDAAWRVFDDAELDPDRFDPFSHPDRYTGAGYVLYTLQVAVWAAHWAGRYAPLPAPPGLPGEVFARTGSWVLAWIAMLGADADTYGATAGPLVAAICKELPGELTTGLQGWA